jgi:uncharacterized protein YlxP (DUF503 family)
VDDVRVYTGTLIADLVLANARSMKERRKPLQALLQRLRNHDYAVAQVGPTDLTRRAFVAVVAVSGGESLLNERLDAVERMLFASEFEVADIRREITSTTSSSRY